MNRNKMTLFSILILILLSGCQENQGDVRKTLVDSSNNESLLAITPDSITQMPNDSFFIKKPFIECTSSHSTDQKEEVFLNSNIAFYQIRSLPEKYPVNEDYFRYVLEKTSFLSISESNFIPGNFEFSGFYTNIDHYGSCFIGKYYFPSAINAAQRRVVIILQKDAKELSILNFDDVQFVDGKLKCDFNIRGKHFFYKLKYSNECKRFIQFN
ncbi:MAG: hypothetical protein QM731_02100 [Chitinophagaceae bacterium]